MVIGTGFSLASNELLCMNNGFYHPAGPAWNPFVFAFIQGGIIGGIFFLVCITRMFLNIKTRDDLFFLVLVLFISTMIIKGLSSYVFWTILGMLNSLRVKDH